MRIGFCGPGNTGKTTLLELVNKELDLDIFTSVTRQFYKERNVKSEEDFLKSGSKKQFQMDLFNFYIKTMTGNFAVNKNFCTDRTPIDHLAYIIYNSEDLTLQEYYIYKEKAINFIINNFDVIFLFQYPMSWSKDDEKEDSFRYLTVQKNIIINDIIRSHMCDIVKKHNYPILYIMPDSSVESRLKYITNILNINTKFYTYSQSTSLYYS